MEKATRISLIVSLIVMTILAAILFVQNATLRIKYMGANERAASCLAEKDLISRQLSIQEKTNDSLYQVIVELQKKLPK